LALVAGGCGAAVLSLPRVRSACCEQSWAEWISASVS
jgi:hypothetical protein